MPPCRGVLGIRPGTGCCGAPAPASAPASAGAVCEVDTSLLIGWSFRGSFLDEAQPHGLRVAGHGPIGPTIHGTFTSHP